MKSKQNTIYNCFIEGGSIREKMDFENLKRNENRYRKYTKIAGHVWKCVPVATVLLPPLRVLLVLGADGGGQTEGPCLHQGLRVPLHPLLLLLHS